MAFSKGLKPGHWLGLIVFMKLLSVFTVLTWYVPDEYWQTLEVAHKQSFGYGTLTWEWQKGIRSYLYPSVFAAVYYLLKITGLDYAEAVILIPRILQALLSAYADYSLYKWCGGRKWALLLILTEWFWFYTCSRTLLNTLETCLVAISLSHFPFKSGILSQYEKEKSTWLWFASVCAFIRPTSAPLWLTLGVYNLLTTNQGRLRLFVRTYLPILALTWGALIGLDSYFHGSLVVTPWEFFRFNFLHNIASFYGEHPWYWYFSHGLPAVLGVTLVPVLIAIFTILRRPSENKVGVLLLIAVGAHLAIHSYIPHKEFRFVLPLLPIFLYLAQDVIVRWSRKATAWQLYVASAVILAGNVVPAAYFGIVHQAGTMQVMPLLRDSVNNQSSILFLMPCHSTPLYSHLHVNVTTRHLNCDPPFNKASDTYEAEYFFNNPQRWWRNEYSTRQPPSHIVLFDKLRGRLESLLSSYTLTHELPHSQFPEGEVGENVLVYIRTSRTATGESDIA